MDFHVLTLFPEMVRDGLMNSILKRAAENEIISFNAVNIRDFAFNKHNSVDDYTYGGGAGMLMQAEPVYQAFSSLKLRDKKKCRVIYANAQGLPFTQQAAAELAKEEELVFLCGHYEGIDERVLDEIVTDNFSIGDYVLTGGELPVMVMIDTIARLIPGVLGNETSAVGESYQNNLLEYPQYTRPEVWHDMAVPPVLMSGDHQKVDEWRLMQSILRTYERRPDMYEKFRDEAMENEKQLKPKRRKLTKFFREIESEDKAEPD
ncbi:MAG: tRNA (guanosine(37)-N1)-methyltransferase TrmD [Lachnospiraceae bacterium]|nr:tRNA (guanosine(37)-N1)-methyltransferase TrmD [Lachnospiraceae bacterium]